MISTIAIVSLIGTIAAQEHFIYNQDYRTYYQNDDLSVESGIDLTKGWKEIKFDYYIQKPWNVPLEQRYQFKDGVHHFKVYSWDKPHTETSHTHPRTEMAIEHSWITGSH